METLTVGENTDSVNRMVRVDEIPWTREALPRAESVDLLTLDDEELFSYARDLQIELESVRNLLHETLAALTRANVQSVRYQARMRDLIGELRRAHADVRTLGSQLRAIQEQAA